MKQLEVGPLRITLHRTVRVALEQTSNLPPSLGSFPIYKVSDYRETCPPQWEDNAVFVALHEKEALWMSFDRKTSGRYEPPVPLAVLVGAGGINALSGEKLGTKLEKDNYLVTPPQPWLDGWKDKDGTVYQFVCTEYKKGEGLTVGEQIMGEECKTGGIGIAVFEAKEPDKLVSESAPRQTAGYSSYDTLEYCCDGLELCSMAPTAKSFSPRAGGQSVKRLSAAEMGVGKGGKIHQKIYPDPHGLEVWKDQPTALTAIYLVNAEQFAEITGHEMPPLPKAATDYYGTWFGLKDKDKGDVKGTDAFTGLKTAFAGDTSNVVVAAKEKKDE